MLQRQASLRSASRAGQARQPAGPGQPLLRAAVLELHAQEPRKYYVQLQLLPPQAEATLSTTVSARAKAGLPGTAARTETGRISTSPAFLNSVFCLRLPGPVAQQHAFQDTNPVATLHVHLMAVPTIDMAPRPLSAGGREMDDLVASCQLPIQGELAGQLLQGDRVTQLLELQNNHNKPHTVGGSLNAYPVLGATHRSVLKLELQLLDLDASPQPPRAGSSVGVGRSSVYTAPFSPTTDHFLSSPLPASRNSRSRQCQLTALISRAENLPEVTKSDGSKGPPTVFVAAKTVRQAAARAAASAVTPAVDSSCNPVWDETLSLSYRESSMPKERLLLALVNKETSKLLFKCSIPVSDMQAGRHYNLAIALGKGRASDGSSARTPKLYITLRLDNYLSDELSRWQALEGQPLTRVQASLLGESLPQILRDEEAVAGVWKLVGDSSMAIEPPTSAAGTSKPIYKQLNTEDEAGMTNWATGPETSAGPGEVPEDSLPLWGRHGSGDLVELMPSPQSSALLIAGAATAASVDPALVLELHSMWKPALTGTGRGRYGALGDGGTEDGEDEGDGPAVDESLEEAPDAIGGTHTSSIREVLPHTSEQEGQPSPAGPMDGPPLPTLEVAAAHDAAVRAARFGPPAGSRQAGGSTFVGRVVIRLEELPENRSGEVCYLYDVPILHFKDKDTGSKLTCTLELRLWDVPSYVQQLQQTERTEEPAPDTPVGANWMETFLVADNDMSSPPAPQLQPTMEAAGGYRGVKELVADLMAKQDVLDELLREGERAESTAEKASWRMRELENRNANLQHEVSQLQQLLEAERQAAVQAATFQADVGQLSPEDMATKLHHLQSAYQREQRKSQELVAQLQNLHNDKVELKELSRRFSELQEAHVAQGTQLRDAEREAARIPQYKLAIQSQESVISRMETALKETLRDRQAAKVMQEEVRRLTVQNQALKQVQGVEEVQVVKAELEQAKEAEAEARRELREGSAERVESMMRAERAEAQYEAISHELVESTRRYAREIASHKARLAEKDAELQGGFGAVSNLLLGTPGGSGLGSRVESPVPWGGDSHRGSAGSPSNGMTGSPASALHGRLQPVNSGGSPGANDASPQSPGSLVSGYSQSPRGRRAGRDPSVASGQLNSHSPASDELLDVPAMSPLTSQQPHPTGSLTSSRQGSAASVRRQEPSHRSRNGTASRGPSNSGSAQESAPGSTHGNEAPQSSQAADRPRLERSSSGATERQRLLSSDSSIHQSRATSGERRHRQSDSSTHRELTPQQAESDARGGSTGMEAHQSSLRSESGRSSQSRESLQPSLPTPSQQRQTPNDTVSRQGSKRDASGVLDRGLSPPAVLGAEPDAQMATNDRQASSREQDSRGRVARSPLSLSSRESSRQASADRRERSREKPSRQSPPPQPGPPPRGPSPTHSQEAPDRSPLSSAAGGSMAPVSRERNSGREGPHRERERPSSQDRPAASPIGRSSRSSSRQGPDSDQQLPEDQTARGPSPSRLQEAPDRPEQSSAAGRSLPAPEARAESASSQPEQRPSGGSSQNGKRRPQATKAEETPRNSAPKSEPPAAPLQQAEKPSAAHGTPDPLSIASPSGEAPQHSPGRPSVGRHSSSPHLNSPQGGAEASPSPQPQSPLDRRLERLNSVPVGGKEISPKSVAKGRRNLADFGGREYGEPPKPQFMAQGPRRGEKRAELRDGADPTAEASPQGRLPRRSGKSELEKERRKRQAEMVRRERSRPDLLDGIPLTPSSTGTDTP